MEQKQTFCLARAGRRNGRRAAEGGGKAPALLMAASQQVSLEVWETAASKPLGSWNTWNTEALNTEILKQWLAQRTIVLSTEK